MLNWREAVNAPAATWTVNVKVPAVVGLTEEAAIAALQGQGFEVALPITRTYNAKFEPGIVFEQIPLANGKAPKGSKVTITVSQGAEMVPVPYVVDKK